MDHLEKLQTPALPGDPLIESTRQVIAEREAAIAQLRTDIAQLETEDGDDFIDLESPRARERRAQRLRLNAELHQATTSLEGARAYLVKREAMFMYRSVRALNAEIDADMQKAIQCAREVSESNDIVARKIMEYVHLTTGVAQKLHSARGRNTLTKDGHIARASLIECSLGETIAFWYIRHISGLVGWQTPWGAGPAFIESAGGSVAQANLTIATLLGDENFDPEIVAAVQAEDAHGTEVALVDQAGG
jgi:hypothetical protein